MGNHPEYVNGLRHCGECKQGEYRTLVTILPPAKIPSSANRLCFRLISRRILYLAGTLFLPKYGSHNTRPRWLPGWGRPRNSPHCTKACRTSQGIHDGDPEPVHNPITPKPYSSPTLTNTTQHPRKRTRGSSQSRIWARKSLLRGLLSTHQARHRGRLGSHTRD